MMTAGLVIVGIVFGIASGVAALCAKILMPAATEFGKDLYNDFKEQNLNQEVSMMFLGATCLGWGICLTVLGICILCKVFKD